MAPVRIEMGGAESRRFYSQISGYGTIPLPSGESIMWAEETRTAYIIRPGKQPQQVTLGATGVPMTIDLKTSLADTLFQRVIPSDQQGNELTLTYVEE